MLRYSVVMCLNLNSLTLAGRAKRDVDIRNLNEKMLLIKERTGFSSSDVFLLMICIYGSRVYKGNIHYEDEYHELELPKPAKFVELVSSKMSKKEKESEMKEYLTFHQELMKLLK